MKSHFLLLAALALLSGCSKRSASAPTDADSSDQQITLVLGSYCTSEEEGIRIYSFNQHTGEYSYLTGYTGLANPSFVWLAPDGKHIYTVGEEDDPVRSSGNAFVYDRETQSIEHLSSQSNQAGAACNVILSPDGRSIFTSSYGSGCITEFPVRADGSLGPGYVLQFLGHSVNPERQDHPYLHAVNFTPDGKYLLGNDLGMDQIHVFALRERAATDTLPLLSTGQLPLQPATEQYAVQVDPGAGPRHLCWAPNGQYAYLLSELSGQLFVLQYADERLSVIQTVQADTLNAGGSADVHVSPDGQFLYASHRLQGDGISIWRIDSETGMITRVGFQATGIHPRNFGITPNGELLLCACRDSHEVQIYKRDAQSGLLSPTGQAIEMHTPTCVQFMP